MVALWHKNYSHTDKGELFYGAKNFIVAFEGDSLQIRTVLHKAIADSRQGMVLHLGLGQRANNPHCNKQTLQEILRSTSDLDGSFGVMCGWGTWYLMLVGVR